VSSKEEYRDIVVLLANRLRKPDTVGIFERVRRYDTVDSFRSKMVQCFVDTVGRYTVDLGTRLLEFGLNQLRERGIGVHVEDADWIVQFVSSTEHSYRDLTV
jgi:hypothetical protein